MANTKEIREKIEAFSTLYNRLKGTGELDKYRKHLSDVGHQADKKKLDYAAAQYHIACENGGFP